MNALTTKLRIKLPAILPILLLLPLLACEIVAIKQNWDLKRQLSRERSQFLRLGDQVPSLNGLTLAGKIETVEYGGQEKETLLLVFSPLCGWCAVNLPNWQSILAQAGPKAKYRIIAVSTTREDAEKYVHQHGLTKVPVLVELEPKDIVSYKLQLTPQTILVDKKGRVRKNWLGAFGPEERADIEKTLGVQLPDSYFRDVGALISKERRKGAS